MGAKEGNKDSEKSDAAKLTKADAAKRVKRIVVTVKDGEEVRKSVAVGADEVLSFKDYGSHVVVVTTDGQKLTDAAFAE
ncbi:MAG: hypothetical protein ACREBN_09295 [Burkholderiaceae bacterium]